MGRVLLSCPGARPRPSSGAGSDALVPRRAVENLPVDDPGRDLPPLQSQHSPHVRRAVAGEALVGPAQGVGGDYDVVEGEQWLIRGGRFDLEHVEASPCNTSLRKGSGEGALVDHWPAGSVDQ